MNIPIFVLRFKKLLAIFTNINYFIAFTKTGVAPSIEHRQLLIDYKFDSLIDVGANVGQFSLFADNNNIKQIIVFEPISECQKKIKKIFQNNKNVKIFKYALGSKNETKLMHLTNKLDSSSFYKPTNYLNKKLNIYSNHSRKIKILRADKILNKTYNLKNLLLKIDTQGFELEILKGFGNKISIVSAIYCECSYIKMYEGQPIYKDIIKYLKKKNFYLAKKYNQSFIEKKLFQADFLFLRKS